MGHLANANEFRVGKSQKWVFFKMYRFSFDKIEKILILNEITNYLKIFINDLEKIGKYRFLYDYSIIQIYNNLLYIHLTVFNGVFDRFFRKLRFENKTDFHAIPSVLKDVERFNYNNSKKFNNKFPKKKIILRISKNSYSQILKKNSTLFLDCLWDTIIFQKQILKKVENTLENRIMRNSYLYWAENTISWTNSFLLSKLLSFELRKFLLLKNLDSCRVLVTSSVFSKMRAETFALYIVKGVLLGYNQHKIISFLSKNIRKEGYIKGFFPKVKGRINRKPRSKYNKRIYRFGKIQVSSVRSKIDYSYVRYESKWGTCSIKIWKV